MIRFNCPNCSKSIKASPDQVGIKAKCPKCGTALTIPGPNAAVVEAPSEQPRFKESPSPQLNKTQRPATPEPNTIPTIEDSSEGSHIEHMDTVNEHQDSPPQTASAIKTSKAFWIGGILVVVMVVMGVSIWSLLTSSSDQTEAPKQPVTEENLAASYREFMEQEVAFFERRYPDHGLDSSESRYDVKKTDSLVVPYQGTMTFKIYGGWKGGVSLFTGEPAFANVEGRVWYGVELHHNWSGTEWSRNHLELLPIRYTTRPFDKTKEGPKLDPSSTEGYWAKVHRDEDLSVVLSEIKNGVQTIDVSQSFGELDLKMMSSKEFYEGYKAARDR